MYWGRMIAAGYKVNVQVEKMRRKRKDKKNTVE